MGERRSAIIIGTTKLPMIDGIAGIRKKNTITMPCNVKSLL